MSVPTDIDRSRPLFNPIPRLEDPTRVASPALLFFPRVIEDNLRLMLKWTGSPERLRPHVKTHKCPGVLRLELAMGIQKFKCATIAEAEMCARSGANDVLLAYPAVGPTAQRLVQLTEAFPETRFSALADSVESVETLAHAIAQCPRSLPVFLDLDCGQHRTGIPAGPEAERLYRRITQSPGLIPAGLHVYDGHIHTEDPSRRRAECEEAFAPAIKFRAALEAAGLVVPELVAGGTPTFPFHAAEPDRVCSPGTCVLWDAGYASHFPDLSFQCAAALFTRVISRPGSDLLCLDLGHKAVASECPHPRVILPEMPEARFVSHSEEHLVVQTPRAARWNIGDSFYAVPWHVCPTVALHEEALVVQDGQVAASWPITARARRLTF